MSKRLPMLLALALGCGDPPKKPAPEIPDFCQLSAVRSLLDSPEAYAHSTVTVHAGARVLNCDGGSSVAVDVDAQVSGPDGRSVPAKLKVSSAPYDDSDGGLQFLFDPLAFDGGALVRADVTFDTGEPGLYQLALKFKPGLGSLQGDVLAMVDRRGDGPRGIAMPYPCTLFDLWGDAMVCLAGDQLLVLRDGALIAQQSADVFMVSDAGLWTVEGNPGKTLTLWSLGGGLQQLARSPLPPSFDGWAPGSGPAMAAGGGAMLLYWDSELLLESRDGGELVGATPAAVPLLSPGAYAMVMRPGEAALIAGQGLGPTGLSQCVVSFGDGGVDCRGDSFALGADRDVLWVSSLAGEISALELSDGGAVVQHRTPFHQGFPSFPDFGQEVLLFQPANFNASTLGTPIAVFSPFSMSSLVRVPLLSPEPAVAGYGLWAQTPLFGATPYCVWTLDPFLQQLRYTAR